MPVRGACHEILPAWGTRRDSRRMRHPRAAGDMNEKSIPRRQFLKKAGTAVATGLASNLSAPAQAQTASSQLSTPPADIILKNGKVITIDRDFTIAQAVAIAGDRIVAVGSEAAMAAHVAPATRVVDLKGRTVTPGIIDGSRGSQEHLSLARICSLNSRHPESHLRSRSRNTPWRMDRDNAGRGSAVLF
jgi:hypothetical protein